MHVTVFLQEMDVEPALHLAPFPEGHFGLLAQPMGPCVPSGTFGGVFNATIRRHPSFDLFHTQNSAAKRKEKATYLQTHRLGQNIYMQSSTRPAQAPLVLVLFFSCHGLLSCWKMPCKQPQRPTPMYLHATKTANENRFPLFSREISISSFTSSFY